MKKRRSNWKAGRRRFCLSGRKKEGAINSRSFSICLLSQSPSFSHFLSRPPWTYRRVFKFDEINRDKETVMDWRELCIGARRDGRIVVDMGAARRKKLADGKKRKGAVRRQRRKRETNVKGREEKTSLPIVASRIPRRGLLGEWETMRNEDEEESFLPTCGFSPLCSGALRYPARTLPFLPHFFRIYLPIGCVYQSLAANVRKRGFGAAIVAAFDVSPWRKQCFEFRPGGVADYLVMNNLVQDRKYFYVNFSLEFNSC